MLAGSQVSAPRIGGSRRSTSICIKSNGQRRQRHSFVYICSSRSEAPWGWEFGLRSPSPARIQTSTAPSRLQIVEPTSCGGASRAGHGRLGSPRGRLVGLLHAGMTWRSKVQYGVIVQCASRLPPAHLARCCTGGRSAPYGGTGSVADSYA